MVAIVVACSRKQIEIGNVVLVAVLQTSTALYYLLLTLYALQIFNMTLFYPSGLDLYPSASGATVARLVCTRLHLLKVPEILQTKKN